MNRSLTTRSRRAAILLLVASVGPACGGSGGSTATVQATTSTTSTTSTVAVPDVPPAEMCPTGQYPVLAAYALDNGQVQWVTCDTSRDMHIAVAADTDHVWLQIPYPAQTLRIDARTGAVLDTSTAPDPTFPADADRLRRTPPATSTVQVSGGQDDPLVGTEIATGTRRWTAVGFPVYDDVWAADATTVYVTSSDPTGATPGTWLAAYLIDTGEERWRADITDYSWPWHAGQGRVFTMWYDLHVLDATDGHELWRTDYGEPAGGFPRMFGAVTNDEMVFVSFTSVGSGGD